MKGASWFRILVSSKRQSERPNGLEPFIENLGDMLSDTKANVARDLTRSLGYPETARKQEVSKTSA